MYKTFKCLILLSMVSLTVFCGCSIESPNSNEPTITKTAPSQTVEVTDTEMKEIIKLIYDGKITSSREYIEDNELLNKFSENQKEEITMSLKAMMGKGYDEYFNSLNFYNSDIYRTIDIYRRNYLDLLGAEYIDNFTLKVDNNYDERAIEREQWINSYFNDFINYDYYENIKNLNISTISDLVELNNGLMDTFLVDENKTTEDGWKISQEANYIFTEMFNYYIETLEYVNSIDSWNFTKNIDEVQKLYPEVDSEYINIVFDLKIKTVCNELISCNDYRSALRSLQEYIKNNDIKDSNNLFTLESLLSDYVMFLKNTIIVTDEFEETSVIYYNGINKITRNINILTSIDGDGQIKTHVGFKDSNWLFLNTVKVKVDNDISVKHFKYDDVQRTVNKGIYEIVEINLSNAEYEDIVNASDITLRFIGDDNITKDHKLSSAEHDAIKTLYKLYNTLNTIKEYYKINNEQ